MEFTINYHGVYFSGMHKIGEMTLVAESREDAEENVLKFLINELSEDGRADCLKSFEITSINEA